MLTGSPVYAGNIILLLELHWRFTCLVKRWRHRPLVVNLSYVWQPDDSSDYLQREEYVDITDNEMNFRTLFPRFRTGQQPEHQNE